MADSGFLESEFERALATRGELSGDNKVVPFEGERRRVSSRERERRFRELLDALPAAIYTVDASGRLTYYNEAAAVLWGRHPNLGAADWCDSWRLFAADRSAMPRDACPMAVALKEDRPAARSEVWAERPDGTRVPFIPYSTPLHDEHGRLIGVVNMLVDITEAKRAEDAQMILMRELHHRVRNTLAIVQAVMGSTAKSAANIEQFTTALTGRIGALAKSNMLLSEDGRSTVSVERLLRNELDAFDDGSDQRLRMSGPAVNVPTSLMVPLGLAIHELTTNAVRHGALSVLGGRVEIGWSVRAEGMRRCLEIDWVESGGPQVAAPTRHGFGSQLLEIVLPRQIQARCWIDYQPSGVRVHFSVPLPAAKA